MRKSSIIKRKSSIINCNWRYKVKAGENLIISNSEGAQPRKTNAFVKRIEVTFNIIAAFSPLVYYKEDDWNGK